MLAGCSAGYKMSSYPQFADFNSQVVEQANSILKRTKASLSYMNKDNFMAHCKLLLWYWNQKKIAATEWVRNVIKDSYVPGPIIV